MARYACELLKQTVAGRKYSDALSLAVRIIRGRVFGQQRLVFELFADKFPNFPVYEIADYRIESLEPGSILDASLGEELAAHCRYIWWDNQQLLSEGGTLWIGRLHGRLSNVGWSRAGNKVRTYFFPLQPNDILLSHFVTLPAFRQRGLFRSIMAFMLCKLALQHAKRFYIDCCDWNIPSIRGIERFGFRRIGCGSVGPGDRLIWTRKDDQRAN